MPIIDREDVRRLMLSDDIDATLVLIRGEPLVVSADQIDDDHQGMIIARRRDLPSGAASDNELDALATRLDNAVRDLGC